MWTERHTYANVHTYFQISKIYQILCVLTSLHKNVFKHNKHSGLSVSAPHCASSSDHKKWVEFGNLASMYNHSAIVTIIDNEC